MKPMSQIWKRNRNYCRREHRMSYKTDEDIMKRMQEHYTVLEDMGYEVVGLFLQGSQNYNLDYEDSDIDTKAIVLPTLDDIILNKKPVSHTHVMENEEHIDVKDIRVMFENILKQNINFVEILFTDYKIINPKYSDYLEELFREREMIAKYDVRTALNCMAGMQLEKFKALQHRYPTTAWKIDKWGYDPKQLSHIIRIEDFMYKYINGIPYEECLIYEDKFFMLEVKKGNAYSAEKAVELAQYFVKRCKEMKDKYLEENETSKNADVLQLMNDTKAKIMKKFFVEELMKSGI